MSYYEAKWSGEYPTLCSGLWSLYKDGELLDIDIPFNGDGRRGTDAGTYGTYSTWHFNDDWGVETEYYESGYDMATWMILNEEWLSSFAPREDWPDIYNAFSYEDWRPNSCGGCI